MARPIRIERAGAWYHVTDRGNERRPIFFTDRDRQHFLDLLAQLTVQFNVVVHAFVLMDNHFHLLLETREANLSRVLHWLNVSYSVWLNRKRGRCGHLFQGRFKAVILDPKDWALFISRYIHLNPLCTALLGLSKSEQQQIRAGAAAPPSPKLVQKRIALLRNYRWSSYRAYIGLTKGPPWLECDTVLAFGGGRGAERKRNYRQYVEQALREGLQNNPWEQLQEQVVLGSKEFLAGLKEQLSGDAHEQRGVKRLREQRLSISEVIRCVEQVKGEKWEQFRDRHGDEGRDLVLYLARKLCATRLKELARLAGVSQYATVTMAIKRLERRMTKQKTLTAMCRRVLQLLNVKI